MLLHNLKTLNREGYAGGLGREGRFVNITTLKQHMKRIVVRVAPRQYNNEGETISQDQSVHNHDTVEPGLHTVSLTLKASIKIRVSTLDEGLTSENLCHHIK